MAYPRRLLWIIFVVGICCSNSDAAVATDCERPPHVDNASVNLVDDEIGDLVSATYACAAGYRLHGEAELFCDLDTDEWQGDPPACRAETTTTSTTTAPNTNAQHRRRKPNLQNIQEDTSIDSEFARHLDLSCVGRERGESVRPPTIDNAYVAKYNRRKKDGNVFLVAFYECEDDFDLELLDNDHLYCSKNTWIGERPRCNRIGGGNEQEDYDGDDDGDGEEDDDDNDNETGQEDDDYTDARDNNNNNHSEVIDSTTASSNVVHTYILEPSTTENQQNEYTRNPENSENVTIESDAKLNEENLDDTNENDADATNDQNEDDNELNYEETLIEKSNVENRYDDNEHTNELVYESNEIIPAESTSSKNTTPLLEQPTECSADRGGCDHGCIMRYEDIHDIIGHTECFCSAGFVLSADDGRSCHDIDECAVNNGGCEQLCTNLPGSVECSCNAGLQIETSNGKTCVDINECHDPHIRHKCPHGCINTLGSYRCEQSPSENEVYDVEDTTNDDRAASMMATEKTCSDGLRLNAAGECDDIDECAEREHGCDNCRNVFGGFECTCPTGYELDDDEKTCRDVNECIAEEDNTVCSHECHNTVGSYECRCPDGSNLLADGRTCLISRGVCEENVNHCMPGICIPVGDSFRCECPTGFQEKTKRCHDIDECSLGTHNCTHMCENTKGSYQCGCPSGLQLDTNYNTCSDIDECGESGEDLCDKTMDCINTFGSYKCVCLEQQELDPLTGRCRPRSGCDLNNGGCSHICGVNLVCSCPHGMRLGQDERTCEIIHPCDVDNGGCSHDCNRMDLSCACPKGWALADGKRCADINECDIDNGGCAQDCINEMGTFSCACLDGYVRDSELPTECRDIDECDVSNGGCSHHCINENGSHHCGCPRGYILDDDNEQLCIDVNECLVHNGKCSHMCHNVPGSMHCACPKGQSLLPDGQTCQMQNECDLNNGGCTHMCSFTENRVKCSCPTGFTLTNSNTCVDIDECAVQNGDCEGGCENKIGSHVCLCDVGFELNKDGRNCADIDECIEDNGNCSNICINLIGSHACACETGYRLSTDRMICIDIDECVEILHGCSHECRNLNGTYECGCPNGYQALDHFVCEDIDECAGERGKICVHGCVNTVGGFNCSCPTGHRLRADGISCEDIDECDGSHICSHNCVNRVGSWECTCPDGWYLNHDGFTCLDIDECADGRGLCTHACENLPGNYRCSCPAGHRLAEDGHQCTDIDECHFNNGGCSHECVNERGAYRCACPIGQSLHDNGLHCQVDDLCAFENGGCQHDCNFVDGGVQCTCRSGFVINRSDNSSCIDVDECLTAPDVCQHECINVVGSYKCKCHRGYRLNEQNQCVDVDECLRDNGGCATEARCINVAGGHRCICQPGFRLSSDKRSCVEIRDMCRPAAKPENGKVKCSRSRHRTQLFYKTKCTFTCNKGYRMLGPAIVHCNGTGHWNNAESTMCISETCPRFVNPDHGIIAPAACLTGGIYPGERCILHCETGYKATNRRIAVCSPQLNWEQSANLTCMAVPALAIKPFIRCPPDATMVLKPNQTVLLLRMERPRTNVDWQNDVDSHPVWGKKLETYLAPGVHTVTFRARSARSNAEDICRTVITVKELRPPAVTHCPTNIEVQLRAGETSREVEWQEPLFHSSSQLKEVFKSKLSGEPLSVGVHPIKYVAIDQDELSAVCEFNITVKTYFHPKRVAQHHHGQRIQAGIIQQTVPGVRPNVVTGSSNIAKHPRKQHLQQHNLGPTEAYVMCPNRVAMKLDTTFPYKLPRGCVIKYVKLPSYNHIRRRHSDSNNMLQHYSSWDYPGKQGQFAPQYRRQFD